KLVAPLGDVPMTTTVEGTIVGTPAYMAPEQATGGNADARTDLYSVGVVLYELLAGHPPFQAPAFGQLVAQVLSSPPPPLPSHSRNGERIPPALNSVVRRALAKNPEDRYHSLRELSQALEVAARAPVRRGPPAWMVAAGAGVLLALGTGVVTARRALRTESPVVTGKLVAVAVQLQAGTPTGSPAAPELAEAPVKMTVVSEPSGARVVEVGSGRALGTTPLSAAVPRSSAPSRLRLEHSGRRPTEVEVVPDAELEVHVAMPRAAAAKTPAPAPGPGKVARTQKHPDPFKL
ncbi:MAG TPA: protein kinase, partial [Myxococcaceae bacterium]